MLIALPSGDWIDPHAIVGIRQHHCDQHGSRVIIHTHASVPAFIVEFDSADAARGWTATFGEKCNEAMCDD